MPSTMVAVLPVELLGTREPEAVDTLLRRMRRQFTSVADYEHRNRQAQVEWLRFRAGQQWNPLEEGCRAAAGRPCLTINTLPQYERQITNEMRQNMPTLTVLPVGDGSDVDTARVLKGIIHHCNQQSHADLVRQWAYDSAVRIGVGYYRMTLEYEDWQSFDQEPRLAGIRNHFAVYLDPASTDPTGRDANWGFIFEHQDKEVFREEWGITGTQMAMWTSLGDTWIDKDQVRIAEYFWKDKQRYTLAQLLDGQTVLLESLLMQPLQQLQERGLPTERLQRFLSHLLTPQPLWAPLLPWIRQQALTAYEAIAAYYPPDFAAEYSALLMDLVRQIRQVRPTEYCTVRWIKTNGYVILEESVWPGYCLPIIRVVGEELDLDNHVWRNGVIQNAMDPMRLENYFLTMMAEHVALSPVPPWIATRRQIEDYEDYWKTANTTPHSVLPYNADPEAPPPQRTAYEPPVQAISLTLQFVQQYTQQAIGIYQGNVGAPSRERSGRAIDAKDRQADTGTFHYVKNLALAMQHEGEIYLELIPKVFSAGKIQRILGDDGSPQMIQILNSQQMSPELQAPMQIPQPEWIQRGIVGVYDIGSGKYDLQVSIGPSYATRRQEAAEQMLEMTRALPEAMGPVVHAVVEKMDWEGAKELAELLKQLPGQILAEAGTNKDTLLAQLKQQLAQTAQQLQAIDAFAQQAQQQVEALAQENKRLKEAHDLKALEVQNRQRETDSAIREAMVDMRVKLDEMRLQWAQLAQDRMQAEREYRLAVAAQQQDETGHEQDAEDAK